MPPTIRDRKATAVRAALSEAALALAVERGWENVRVEDIAARAGMSTRSFSNYFRGKNEALYALSEIRAEQLRIAVLDRPAGEPLWDVVIAAVRTVYGAAEGVVDRAMVERIRLAGASPGLQGEYLRSQAALEPALAAGIAERLGLDVDAEVYPRLMAAVVVHAVRVALEHWLRTDDRAPLGESLTSALERVAAGLPASSGR